MKLHEISSLTQQQIDFLNESVNGTWNYNEQTKAVDVTGDVNIPGRTTSIPIQFGNVTGSFYCNNTKITSLQYAPQSVGGSFFCHHTNLTSLQGAPQSVGGNFLCSHTAITSLQHLPDVKRMVYINNTPYEKQTMPHILQLFKVRPRIKQIRLSDEQLGDILNKHLPTGDVLACQEELIDAGYGKIARF